MLVYFFLNFINLLYLLAFISSVIFIKLHFVSIFFLHTYSFFHCLTNFNFISYVFQFDINMKYKSIPVMLEGGYEDWLSRYPALTTNALVSPPKESVNNKFLLGMYILFLLESFVACIFMQSLSFLCMK